MGNLKVLFLASEADPLVKIGGLGDVAGSLPAALQRLPVEITGGSKLDVRLVIPFHSVIRKKYRNAEPVREFMVPTKDGSIPAQAYRLEVNGVQVYLISGEPVGEGSPVYSSDAVVDGRKYFFLSLAALELVKAIDWKPDILHANDWHTALSVYALKFYRSADPFFKDARSVLTIHNLPYMGAGTEAAFDFFGLPPSRYPRMPWWARKLPLPLGLQTADRIVAVSPNYAKEIFIPEYSCGLENVLKARHKAVSGILNGLDQESWDPANDPEIPQNYAIDSLHRRKANKTALVKEFSFDPDPNIPLLILISRMDQQKGVDLALAGLAKAVEMNWQVILLGTGDPKLEKACLKMEKAHPQRVRAALRFDAGLARRMYAGADILLMPSRYEPCGLAQMIAMRYGCVPLARATGGLRDTIVDVGGSGEKGTGFLFKPATAAAFVGTMQRALDAYRDPVCWTSIQQQGMHQDFSWENSAAQYVRLYRELLRISGD